MSRENVELVRRGYEVFQRAVAAGDDLLPLARKAAAPDLVVEMGLLEGTFRGPEGFVRFIEGQMAILDDLRTVPEEFIDAGDRVVVPVCITGHARSTGIPVEYRYVHLWTVRDGKVTHVRLYGSKAKALEAAGLRE